MSKRAAFLLTLLGLGMAHGAAAGWSSGSGLWYRYPLPGAEVKSLVSDPSTPGGFYAGTAQGGIYRSADTGLSWTSTPGGAPFPGYSVTSLCVDPVREGTVWAGLTGVVRGGLLARSEDRGRTWREVRKWDQRAASRVVAVSVQSGRRSIAVGGDYGVELSDDDGASWSVSAPSLDPGSGVSFLAFHPTRQGVLFCGSFRHPFRSTDQGRTWKRIAAGMIEDTEVFALDFSPGNPDEFWAATCGWVYRTVDGGASWTRYKEGLTDRRTHTIAYDLRDPSRVLAGTTGGLFETLDLGRSFRRIGPDVVVNALAFDPRKTGVLLVATESRGILRSEDGGITVQESNRGLSEARVSSVAKTASGRIVVARAADGASGGLWSVDPTSGESERLLSSPPATVVALAAAGERLLAGTPDGVFTSESGSGLWTLVLAHATRAFASEPGGRVLSATDAGVYDSRDGGRTWARSGSLTGRIDAVRRARFWGAKSDPTFAVDTGGRTLWWDGKDWVFQAVRLGPETKLTGGFGRPRAGTRWTPEPIGLEIDVARSLLLFRPEEESADGVALALPENGLQVAGWAGDPRGSDGLYLATIGRGLFRFLRQEPPSPAPAVGDHDAATLVLPSVF